MAMQIGGGAVNVGHPDTAAQTLSDVLKTVNVKTLEAFSMASEIRDKVVGPSPRVEASAEVPAPQAGLLDEAHAIRHAMQDLVSLLDQIRGSL